MKKKQVKIIYSKYGLANFFGDYIEINEKLKYNKPLRDYIVKHELGHKKEFDLMHEFYFDWFLMPSLIKFIIVNPKTWIDLLPVQIRKGKFIYDLNLLILYSFSILSLFLIKKFLI